WKPERDTSSASHSHATGQIVRCFAMKANLISLPSRRRLRPFLGFRAPPSASPLPCAAARLPSAPASSGRGQERRAADRSSPPEPTCAARSHERRDHGPLAQPQRPDPTNLPASSLNSRLNFLL